MLLETEEITEQLKDEITRLGEALATMKKQNTKKTKAYRMTQYKYNQLKIALLSINNFRMCIPDDFRKPSLDI